MVLSSVCVLTTLAVAIPYGDLEKKVQRLYLKDLLSETDLSPNLGILQLIVLPQNRVGEAAQKLLQNVENKTQFTQRPIIQRRASP
ncbi:Rpn family recombination-promoting nuclease/putative transposase [Anabaenopsis elenkinii]|uniref:Rpn family recombination-promoting nuclease/putative transposase n=1 Tax=Anabaenopsis elenkinii TaxID=156213 RepID=UPI001CECC987|nr:Rpn family recombination-promoting nuclease/putative transposase [Anabaenopsis elenkinii]